MNCLNTFIYVFCYRCSYLFLLIIVGIFISADLGFAQSASDQRRETYYQNLEARARSLSQKLAEISGTEPIPFERKQGSILSTMGQSAQPSSPQSAYDSLPGPVVEPKAPQPVSESETLYRADGTPVILQTAPTTSPAIASSSEAKPKKRAIRRNMEKERGSYFIQPFIGVAVPPSSQSFKGLRGVASIETEIGHALGLSFGRRWDNLEGELHLGYLNLGYGDITIPRSPAPDSADGQLEVFQIGTRLGYGIPFAEKGWFRVAGGFGFANRRDVINIYDGADNPSFVSSETAFTYDLLLSLGYEVGMGLDAFLAYRLLGVSENGDFDSVAMHLFQVGLGANF
ncbi:MAG: outer membrane beta-barrel protein [Opitutae bacterium]|nr:outer membrane beta-barrel protein [Opitutae bacterium]